MKTATLTAKVNRWLHEHLAMKTPAKLLGGLALGALVMTAAALPLGTTYADEPARPLTSERIQCYPEDMVVCLYDDAKVVDVTQRPIVSNSPSIAGVRILPEDAWRFDSPYYDDFLVEEPRESVAATVIHRYDLGPEDEFMSDAPFFHALNEGKVARPPSINGITCYPELDIC